MFTHERPQMTKGRPDASGGETRCPRALYEGDEAEVTFDITNDPAVQEIARRVVAGIDRKYSLDPDYGIMVEGYGEKRAQKLIEDMVSIPGACDLIQTEMSLGGIGLFGGLSEDSSHFVFHEWLDGNDGQLMTKITPQEAREIVSGKKKSLKFFKKGE